MSTLKKMLAVVLLFPALAIGAETVSQPVSQYRYDAAADFLYVVGPNLWGSAACPNAFYVTIRPTLAGHKQMFAAIVAAQAAGKNVRFYGECGTDPNYFDATYIIVE